MAILLVFILIANIVAMVLMYYCLGDLGKKEKLIFIGAGVGIMYILTSIVYWISTYGIEMTEVSEIGKNLITFLFVPVNSLLVLPLLAKSYAKFKSGRLDLRIFLNRGIALGVLLLIVLVVECIYFKNIQVQVVELIKNNKEQTQKATESELDAFTNVLENQNFLSNDTSNEVNIDNEIVVNEVNSNETTENKVTGNNIYSNAEYANEVIE